MTCPLTLFLQPRLIMSLEIRLSYTTADGLFAEKVLSYMQDFFYAIFSCYLRHFYPIFVKTYVNLR